MTDLWLSCVFFQALNTPKLVFRRGCPPHTLTPRRFRRLISEAPPTQIPGYTYDRVGARIAPTHRPI